MKTCRRLNPSFAELLNRIDPFIQRGPLVHQLERILAARLQAQVDPRQPASFIKRLISSLMPVTPGQAAPANLFASHTLAELLEKSEVKSEVVIGDPQAIVTQTLDLIDLFEHRVEVPAAEGASEKPVLSRNRSRMDTPGSS